MGVPALAREGVRMPDTDTHIDLDLDLEDLPELLAQLAAIALLELAARTLVPAAAVWAG